MATLPSIKKRMSSSGKYGVHMKKRAAIKAAMMARPSEVLLVYL